MVLGFEFVFSAYSLPQPSGGGETHRGPHREVHSPIGAVRQRRGRGQHLLVADGCQKCKEWGLLESLAKSGSPHWLLFALSPLRNQQEPKCSQMGPEFVGESVKPQTLCQFFSICLARKDDTPGLFGCKALESLHSNSSGLATFPALAGSHPKWVVIMTICEAFDCHVLLQQPCYVVSLFGRSCYQVCLFLGAGVRRVFPEESLPNLEGDS